MHPRITMITLGVADLDRSMAFFDLQGGLKLALWPRSSIAADAGLALQAPSSTEFTLGHNVGSAQEVDTAMAQAAGAGARVVKPAQPTFWGGYAGYFEDPDGHLWEVVFNPAFEGDRMSKPVINLADVELRSRPDAFKATGTAAGRFDARIGMIGPRVGAQKLGYNVTAVAPGKRAFPFHNHHVNEEMFFVLEGEGEVRIGGAIWPIRQGDVIACPPGGKEAAHQIVNTGTAELKYLAVSTRLSPEVVEYPDSGKFGLLAEYPAAPGEPPRAFRFVGRESLGIDYWDGE